MTEQEYKAGNKRQLQTGEELKAKQKKDDYHDDVCKDFVKWMTNEKFNISSKVEINLKSNDSSRYGLYAVKEIRQDEVIFTIPRESLLWEGTSRISSLLSTSIELQQSPSGWVPLVISLMYEYHNRKDSKWKPYLDFLPTVQQLDQPMFWSYEHLALLEGTGCLDARLQDVKGIEEEYKTIALPFIQKHFDEKVFTLDLYKHMVACIMAYSFTELPSQTDEEDDDDEDETVKKNTPMMVPMADLLNHVAANNAHLEFGEEKLSMVATKNIEIGEQVYNTYGELSNSQLLQMYGFVEEPGANHYDVVTLPISLLLDQINSTGEKEGEIACKSEKVEWLKDQGLDEDSDIMIGMQGILTESEFGVFVKILPLDEEEFERFCEDSDLEFSDDDDDDSDQEEEDSGLKPDSFQCKKFSFKKLKQLSLSDSVVNLFRNSIEKRIAPLKDRLQSLKTSTWREERVRGLIDGQIDIFNKLHQALTP